MADNYSSVTKKHFLPVCGSDGRDPFTRDMVMRSSGFIKDIPTTILRSKEVRCFKQLLFAHCIYLLYLVLSTKVT